MIGVCFTEIFLFLFKVWLWAMHTWHKRRLPASFALQSQRIQSSSEPIAHRIVLIGSDTHVLSIVLGAAELVICWTCKFNSCCFTIESYLYTKVWILFVLFLRNVKLNIQNFVDNVNNSQLIYFNNREAPKSWRSFWITIHWIHRMNMVIECVWVDWNLRLNINRKRWVMVKLNLIKFWWILIYWFLVCGSSAYSTTVGFHLVWRCTRLSTQVICN